MQIFGLIRCIRCLTSLTHHRSLLRSSFVSYWFLKENECGANSWCVISGDECRCAALNSVKNQCFKGTLLTWKRQEFIVSLRWHTSLTHFIDSPGWLTWLTHLVVYFIVHLVLNAPCSFHPKNALISNKLTHQECKSLWIKHLRYCTSYFTWATGKMIVNKTYINPSVEHFTPWNQGF